MVLLVDGLETLLLERSPDFLVVLDGALKVVHASAGLRSAVPMVQPGADFRASLDEGSQERLRQALSIDREVTSALPLELVHRGKERLITTAYRFFGMERPYTGGVGREAPSSAELIDQVEVLRRRYHESVSQLASLTGRLRELATMDSLTGVLNRRAFLDHADGEWVRHRRHNHALSCAMVDVDGFKKINDTFGHAAGDAVLAHIGTLLRATLRASDLPARLGGDEFAALMPETDIAGAASLGERLLGRVQQRPLSVLDQHLVTSLSIGIAAAKGCNSVEELLAKADRALYRAKKEGRARVCIAA
ncbi:MAG: GGDEF domain-containing protein [Myxococcales bacterium]|nr:GGDEF domain-containing protein [Myxococcales bacterium]